MKTRSALAAVTQTATTVNEESRSEHLHQEKTTHGVHLVRENTLRIYVYIYIYIFFLRVTRIADMLACASQGCKVRIVGYGCSRTRFFWHGTTHNLQITLTMKESPSLRNA